MSTLRTALAAGLATVGFASAVTAQDLNVYCPMSEDDCISVLAAFRADTGIDSSFVRLGAGEVLARIRAESKNPQAGLWLAGAADLFIQGASEGLLERYAPEGIDRIPAKFRSADDSWTPIAISPVAFFYNPEYVTKLGKEPPSSWKDYADPAYEGAIVLTHPASSGTAFVVLSTLVQIYGEDEAFRMLKEIDANVLQYARSAGSLTQMVASGEVAISMAYTHGLEVAIEQGFPIGVSFPVEGTGYELNSTAIIANAPEKQRAAAQKFIDWAVSEAGQRALGATYREAVVEGIINPDLKIRTDSVKLIDYDSEWAGQNRSRLLQRYESEVRDASAAN